MYEFLEAVVVEFLVLVLWIVCSWWWKKLPEMLLFLLLVLLTIGWLQAATQLPFRSGTP